MYVHTYACMYIIPPFNFCNILFCKTSYYVDVISFYHKTNWSSILYLQFDITFPALPCSILSVDAMDISGEQHLDVVCKHVDRVFYVIIYRCLSHLLIPLMWYDLHHLLTLHNLPTPHNHHLPTSTIIIFTAIAFFYSLLLVMPPYHNYSPCPLFT